MKRIINGKRYDTDKAECLANASYSNRRDFSYWSEDLYRKRTGEYFLYGEGGPASRYAVTAGQNVWSGGEKIIPISEDTAREWAEKYLDADEYEKIFGTTGEDEEKKTVSFSLKIKTIQKIKSEAVKKGIPMSEYIDYIINA